MRQVCTVLIVLFLAAVSRVYGQGGTVVPIEPCAITYATPLVAGVPLAQEVRGYCGVPVTATAVFLNMKAGGSATAGKLYVWPYGNPLPSYSQMNYTPNYAPGEPRSGQALVRLRYALLYGDDLWVQSNTNVNFSAVVEGYITP